MFTRRNQLWWLLGALIQCAYYNWLKWHIQRGGHIQPLLVSSDGVILDGWKRYKIAKQLGYESIPVVIIDGEVEQCSLDVINCGG